MRGRAASGLLCTLLKRDLLSVWRRAAEAGNPLVFFVMVGSLFPLALGNDGVSLARIGPGAIWIAVLLATLLSLEGMFRSDLEDGSLDQLLLSPHPLPLLVGVKALAHWVCTGVPLLLLTPVLALMFDLSLAATRVLLATLLLGTPVLSLLGSVGVALTVGLRSGGLLLALMLLPLYVPVLVFGTGASLAAAQGLPSGGQLYLLGALLTLALTLAPFATAAALRARAA